MLEPINTLQFRTLHRTLIDFDAICLQETRTCPENSKTVKRDIESTLYTPALTETKVTLFLWSLTISDSLKTILLVLCSRTPSTLSPTMNHWNLWKLRVFHSLQRCQSAHFSKVGRSLYTTLYRHAQPRLVMKRHSSNDGHFTMCEGSTSTKHWPT